MLFFVISNFMIFNRLSKMNNYSLLIFVYFVNSYFAK